MLALRLHGQADIRLHEEAQPSGDVSEPLVRTLTVGLCGSDRTWYLKGGLGGDEAIRPLVLGHEAAGVIESGPRTGQRVVIDPHVPCRSCEYCVAGWPNLCPTARFAGHAPVDGALRQYMTWPEQSLIRIPDSMSMPVAAMLEPLTVAMHAFDLGRAKDGSTIGVLGCGPIGLMLVQLAVSRHAAKVCASDPLDHRIDEARRLGATVLPHETAALAASISDATSGRGLDVTFEVSGEDSALDAAIAATRPGGRVVMVGIPVDDRTAFQASVARRKGLTLTYVRRARPSYVQAIDLVEHGSIELAPLISHRFPIGEHAAAFGALVARTGHKIIIEMSRD